MALLTLTMSVSTYVAGLGGRLSGLGARRMATVLGLAFAVPGIRWLMLQRWLDRGDSTVHAEPPMRVDPLAQSLGVYGALGC
jgi:hypothetical protein